MLADFTDVATSAPNGSDAASCLVDLFRTLYGAETWSSQVNTLPIAKSKTRSKQNKDMHKFSSVYSERGVPLPVLTSGGE